MIMTMNNDNIFEPSGNKNFIFQEEAQVPSSQKRTLPGIFQESLKCLLCLHRTAPVAGCNAWPGHPDLPYFTLITPHRSLGMNNDKALISGGASTAHE